MEYYHHTSTGLGKNSAMNLNCLLLPTTFLKGWMVVKMWTLLFWIFSKAFDVVPHKHLLRKLRLYGIEGRTLQWISCFLQGRTQIDLFDSVRSHPGDRTAGDDVVSGVHQGTVMGPLLFLLYINDLPSVLNPTTSSRFFADDWLIYRTINSISDHVVLQNDLKALHDWGTIWGLKFNVAKCNMMHLSRKVVKPVRFYILGGEVITSVEEAK